MSNIKSAARQITLQHYPEGPVRPSDFAVVDQAIPVVGEKGEFLVRNIYISVDPMLRLFIDAAPSVAACLRCRWVQTFRAQQSEKSSNRNTLSLRSAIWSRAGLGGGILQCRMAWVCNG